MFSNPAQTTERVFNGPASLFHSQYMATVKARMPIPNSWVTFDIEVSGYREKWVGGVEGVLRSSLDIPKADPRPSVSIS